MRTLAVAVVPALFLALPAAGDVVVFDSSRPHTASGGTFWKLADYVTGYVENDSMIETPGGSENEARVGALLTLAGNARFVTSVSIGVWGPVILPTYTQTLDVRLSLYTNVSGQPGSLVWTGVEHVTITSLAVGQAMFRPQVMVPDQVFYAISYHEISVPTRPVGAWFSTVQPTVGINGQLMSQDSTTLAWAPSPFTQPGDNIELRIEANSCYANCDASSIAPVLNVNDFICFQNRFATGDPYANCDASSIAPVLNVNDFTCFLNQYAAGCH